MSFLFIVGLICILRFGFTIQQSVLLNELVEETLICHLQNQPNCLAVLNEKLRLFHFQQIRTRLEKQGSKASLKVDAFSGFGVHFIKESELALELSITK